MDTIRIRTTQNVDIDYEPASIGDRILATLLDYLFFLAYFILLAVIGGMTQGFGGSIAFFIILALPVLFYDLVCEAAMQGQSFGKMIMKIKVVMLDGTPPAFSAYLVRWLLRLVDTRLFTGAVALLAILFSEKGQRLGDMAAGTTVIKLKQKVQLRDTILIQTRPEYKITYPEVEKLSDADIHIIKEILRMGLQSGNFSAIEKCAAKTKATMGINPTLPPVQFLQTVLMDYSTYQFEK